MSDHNEENEEDIEVPEGIPPDYREQRIRDQRRILRDLKWYRQTVNERISEIIRHNKEVGTFHRGITNGSAFGILGNFLVSYFVEYLRVFFDEQP